MAYSFWDTIQTKGRPGKNKVTEDQKNALIERAVSTWKNMGLTDPQIAFATTVMGHKSGFDANVRGAADGSDAYGLGQFTDDIWEDAVNRYNDNYQPGIDAALARKDPDAQMRVIGAWVPHVWGKAGEIAGDPNVKGYNQAQIAYGTWNQGPDAHPKEVGNYLKTSWHDPDLGGYFDTTYDRAMQGLSLRKDYLASAGEEDGQQTYPPGIPGAGREAPEKDPGPYAVAGGAATAASRDTGNVAADHSAAASKGARRLRVTVTHYCNCWICTRKKPGDRGYGISADGTKAGPGTVAADVTIIPFGSGIAFTYRDGSPFNGVVHDTGNAVQGNVIDIWMPSHEAASRAGSFTTDVQVTPPGR